MVLKSLGRHIGNALDSVTGRKPRRSSSTHTETTTGGTHSDTSTPRSSDLTTAASQPTHNHHDPVDIINATSGAIRASRPSTWQDVGKFSAKVGGGIALGVGAEELIRNVFKGAKDLGDAVVDTGRDVVNGGKNAVAHLGEGVKSLNLHNPLDAFESAANSAAKVGEDLWDTALTITVIVGTGAAAYQVYRLYTFSRPIR